MLRRVVRFLLTLVMVGTASVAISVSTAGTAQADGCYTWSGTLQQGDSGEAVRQLQIRVSGYPGRGAVLALDGEYGPATAAAVQRFQQAYGLSADGIAGSQTFNQIYALQDDDCTPAHFTYSEFNDCNSDWSGGAVSASEAQANALVNMWKLEAMRHALGDAPIVVSSAFRSRACNDAAGGASDSRHLYGAAVDLVGNHSLCTLAQAARDHGFNGILGPGYPGHDDHTHVDTRSSQYWDAPSCGV
ncbi:D-Ala-D-Ala carboxypeptidase family metallohydrolase [Streptomyces sp. B6B3]|uniref:D-Ala-D-Ala carboxypeptidase family metallohydrolase n=1 Tax=Streptomyces sp. B6B3 TaxID=3153570 RepID=UPI00325EF80B